MLIEAVDVLLLLATDCFYTCVLCHRSMKYITQG